MVIALKALSYVGDHDGSSDLVRRTISCFIFRGSGMRTYAGYHTVALSTLGDAPDKVDIIERTGVAVLES